MVSINNTDLIGQLGIHGGHHMEKVDISESKEVHQVNIVDGIQNQLMEQDAMEVQIKFMFVVCVESFLITPSLMLLWIKKRLK